MIEFVSVVKIFNLPGIWGNIQNLSKHAKDVAPNNLLIIIEYLQNISRACGSKVISEACNNIIQVISGSLLCTVVCYFQSFVVWFLMMSWKRFLMLNTVEIDLKRSFVSQNFGIKEDEKIVRVLTKSKFNTTKLKQKWLIDIDYDMQKAIFLSKSLQRSWELKVEKLSQSIWCVETFLLAHV